MDGKSSNHLESFFPFSLGPRACIGRKYAVHFEVLLSMVLIFHSFAWMEMLKTLGTIFKMFRIKRATLLETEVREGFFMKNSECVVWITRRQSSQAIMEN